MPVDESEYEAKTSAFKKSCKVAGIRYRHRPMEANGAAPRI